jgi:hypothetical protein
MMRAGIRAPQEPGPGTDVPPPLLTGRARRLILSEVFARDLPHPEPAAMSEAHHPHPQAFRELCRRAIDLLESLKAASPTERTGLLRQAQEAMREIDAQVKSLDLGDPTFNDEQGDLIAAASALQAIELDRGGPRVPRYVDTAIEAIRHVSSF